MNKRYTGPERRRFRRAKGNFIVSYRVNFPLSARIRVGDREIETMALDLSESGIGILTDYDLPVSALVTVKFILFNETAIHKDERIRSIGSTGDVCYSVFTKQRAYRFGMRFNDISPEDRSYIADFVKTQERIPYHNP